MFSLGDFRRVFAATRIGSASSRQTYPQGITCKRPLTPEQLVFLVQAKSVARGYPVGLFCQGSQRLPCLFIGLPLMA
jgi:hypothetical protein